MGTFTAMSWLTPKNNYTVISPRGSAVMLNTKTGEAWGNRSDPSLIRTYFEAKD